MAKKKKPAAKQAKKKIKKAVKEMFDDDRFQEMLDSDPDELVVMLFDLGPTLGTPALDRILTGRVKQLLASGTLKKILDENGKVKPSAAALKNVRKLAKSWEEDGEGITEEDIRQEAQSDTLVAFVNQHQGELN